MTEIDRSLGLCSRAMSENETAVHLVEQKDRLELAIINEDIPLVLDSARSFLESLFKTILNDRQDLPDLKQDFKPFYREVRDLIVFNQDSLANDILQRMGSQLVHNVDELRNNFGAASHGDDGYYENPIEIPELEMVVSMVDGFASCLLTKHRSSLSPHLASRIHYADHQEFNDWLDEQFPGYSLQLSETNLIELTSSKLLFTQDPNQYREMLLQYSSTEDEDNEF